MKKYILKEILHVTSNNAFTWGKITNLLNSNNIILESEDIIDIEYDDYYLFTIQRKVLETDDEYNIRIKHSEYIKSLNDGENES